MVEITIGATSKAASILRKFSSNHDPADAGQELRLFWKLAIN
jgi:hypothetical protein